jgi:hypothetical protein
MSGSATALLTALVGLAAPMVAPLPAAAQQTMFPQQGFTPGRAVQQPFVGRGNPRDVFVPPRRPRGPGPGAAIGLGLGLGVLGTIITHGAQQPVYEDVEQPRRARRRPVIVEDEDLEPEERPRRRPRVAARPPQAPPPRATNRAAGPPPARPVQAAQPPRRVIVPPVAETRLVREEVLVEIANGANLDAVLRRYRLTAMSSQRFELANATIHRLRIDSGRSARDTLAQMAGDRRIALAQPNYVYTLQQPASDPVDNLVPVPAAITEPPVIAPSTPVARKPQYVPARIGWHEGLAQRGPHGVRIAIIDSGIDRTHPEFATARFESFDALDGADPAPHSHGTAMAGAIAANASLAGLAPEATMLAARAFSGRPGQAGGSGTSFHILRALDWSVAQGAQVLSLSFTGPNDALIARALAAAHGRGVVAVAAAGNAGPQSRPLYPAAQPEVIAVTATDARDAIFSGANVGRHVAIAAPGVDVLAPAPDGGYAFSTGTSIATAHATAVIGLMLQRAPAMKPSDVRAALMSSAFDLGPKGPDTVFGAGRLDAASAVARAEAARSAQR